MTADNPDERMIMVARFPAALHPLPIYGGEPPAPISCAWLGVARVHDGMPAHPETFVLYFLDATGTPQELLQYETLRIAVDQAYAIAGYPQQEWATCDIPVLDDGRYDVAQLNNAVSNEMPILNRINAVIELLQAAAEEPTKLQNAIRALQAMVWHTKGWATGLSEASSEALRDLAYDLDYYQPDPDMRTEDPTYFVEDRALEEIRNVLARVHL